MEKPRLHVMFCASARGTLIQALDKVGRNERVVAPLDCFSFGPINPPDAAVRADWVGEQLGYDGWEEAGATIAPFMAESLSPDVSPVAWFSQRDAQSFTGFLEWLWQLGDAPCAVVDVSDLRLTYGGRSRLAISPSTITADEFIRNDLLDSAAPLGERERLKFRALWSSLKIENASLRVLGENGLVSAPLEFFDPLILSHVESDWRKMALIVGHVLGGWTEEYRQSGDLLVASRIRVLAEDGRLEWRGDLADMHHCEVRLPPVRHGSREPGL